VLKSFTLRETDEYCCVEWIVPVTCSSPFYDAQKSMAVTQDDIMIHGSIGIHLAASGRHFKAATSY